MTRKFQKTKVRKEAFQRGVYHDEDLVSVEIAAEFLGMSIPFLKKWSGKGIPFYRIGSSKRFKIADLRLYLEGCRVE